MKHVQFPHPESKDYSRPVVQAWLAAEVENTIGALKREAPPDRGQGLAEYALILALIAVVAIVGLLFLGSQISTALQNIGESV